MFCLYVVCTVDEDSGQLRQTLSTLGVENTVHLVASILCSAERYTLLVKMKYTRIKCSLKTYAIKNVANEFPTQVYRVAQKK